MKQSLRKGLSLVLALALFAAQAAAPAVTIHAAESAAVAEAASKEKWTQKLEQYLTTGDRSQVVPYPGFHFDLYDVTMGEEETISYQMLDEQGNDVTDQLDWYVLTNYPFFRLFDQQESQDDTIPPYMNGNEIEVQRTSLVKIDAPGSLTSRKIAGRQEQMSGWLVGIYQDSYAHLLPLRVKRGKHLTEQREVEAEVSRVLHEMNNMSDLDKAVYAFDYIVDRVSYDYGFIHDALGNPALHKTLIEQWAVCDGYAHAYMYLLKRSGMVAERQVGEVIVGGQGETASDLHAWNRVLLDDGWYYMDTTWADTETKDYRYLFADRDFMASNRVLPDDGTNIGQKYLGYRHFEPNSEYRTDQTVAQQVARIKDTLSPDTTEVLVFISQEENPNGTQYDIPDMLTDPAKGITCGYGMPKYILGYAGVVFSYPITISADIPQTQVTESYTMLAENGTPCIQITLSQPAELTQNNIILTGARLTDAQPEQLSPTQYIVPITGIVGDSLTIELRKTGFQFTGSHVVPIGEMGRVETPHATFTGTDMFSGVLSGLAPTAEYNTGNGVWVPAGQESVVVELPKFNQDFLYKDNVASVYVRNKSQIGTYSDIQQIRISRPGQTPTWIRKEVDTASTNKISCVSGTEYRRKDGGSWTTAKTDVLTDLPKGTYEFRIKGSSNRFPSETVELTIENLEAAKPAVPAAPQNVQAADITQTSARLTWDAPADIAPAAYVVMDGNQILAQVKGDALSTELTGLKPDTAYNLSVYAQNSEGSLSGEAGLVSFRTLSASLTWNGASLSIGGNIAVNFFANIPDSLLQDTEIVISVENGATVTLPAAKAENTKNGYRFTASVAVRQMTDKISLQVMQGGKPVGKPIPFSVRMYAERLLQNAGAVHPESVKQFVRTMLYHGEAMQQYKKHNLNDLAAHDLDMSDLEEMAAAITPEQLSAYQPVVKGSVAGLPLHGVNLSLEDETALRFFFEKGKDYQAENYRFTINGVPCQTQESGKYIYAEVKDIAASRLNHTVNLSVNGGEMTVAYSPMSYVRAVLQDTDAAPALKQVARSMVLYNNAAQKLPR